MAPTGDTTRPTADRTRETLFSMLMSRLGTFDGLSVGDLFAGSGALGLEALSRGATHAIFVEQDAAALRALRSNIANLRAQSLCDVRSASVMGLGPRAEPLDLLMMDPPYGSGAGAVSLDRLKRLGWIGAETWISIETAREEAVLVKGFEIEATRDVGKARLHIVRSHETPRKATDRSAVFLG